MTLAIRLATGMLLLALGCHDAEAESSWSQFVDPDDGRFDASRFLADNVYGSLPLPIIITDPAVDVGLGAVGLFFHESEEQQEKRLAALRNAENSAPFLLTQDVVMSAVGINIEFDSRDNFFSPRAG